MRVGEQVCMYMSEYEQRFMVVNMQVKASDVKKHAKKRTVSKTEPEIIKQASRGTTG